jgi:uncharacterized membrane protein YgcG
MEEYDDKEGLTTLCKRLVDPGGSVPDPTWVAPVGVIPPPPQPLIRNRGTMVTRAEQKLLERLAYFIRHQHRVQRPLVLANATRNEMKLMGSLITQERELRAADKPDMPDKFNPKQNIRTVLDVIEGYLAQVIGSFGAPLTYVIREAVQPDNTVVYDADYSEVMEELVDHCRHDGAKYRTDNTHVWKVIRHIFYGTSGQGWVEPHSRSSNGRAAYLALLQRYLRTKAKILRAEEAQKALQNSHYDGKSHRFTFQNYVDLHKEAHEEIARNGEAPLTGRQKVHFLLDRIDEPSMAPHKVFIRNSTALETDFDEAVAVLTDHVSRTKKPSYGTRNVSTFRGHASGNPDAGRGGGRGDGRGRGGGRGGRGGRFGRGRGGGRGGGRFYDNKRKRDDNGYLPPDVWERLQKERKEANELINKKIADARRGVSSVSTITPELLRDSIREAVVAAMDTRQEDPGNPYSTRRTS